MTLHRIFLGSMFAVLAFAVGGYAVIVGASARAIREQTILQLPWLSVPSMTRAPTGLSPVGAPPVAPQPSAAKTVPATDTTAAKASSPAAASAAAMRLAAPSMMDRLESMVPPALGKDETIDASLYVVSYQFDGRILSEPSPEGRVRGIVRRGDRIAALKAVPGTGCPGGSWLSVVGGYVCTTDGFTPNRSGEASQYQKPADRRSPLPFDYGMVRSRTAQRLRRLPTAAEEAQLRSFTQDPAATGRPDVLSIVLDGDYYVALDDVEEGPSGRYWRTVWGHYVREDQVEVQPLPVMSGEILAGKADEGGLALPIAFVFGEERPLYRLSDGKVERIGSAAKYARFAVAKEVSVDGRRFVVDELGRALERSNVRVASRSTPHADVPEGSKWIHVDLDEQTLVAYEGRTPVFATLVASGKTGYDTPAGLFRVQNKHLSITMQGDDPKDGHYEVEEVPWTMFYFGGFALHGAYWHDDFGKVRSHGCTNIAPLDARWLYYWTTPQVPAGWYAVRSRLGTWVQFTRRSENDVIVSTDGGA